MDCLINMGKKIPDDYSLVCLSGSYLTQIPTPKICSSNPDNAEIGKMAARELLNLINGKESPKDSNICSGYSLEEGGTLAFYKGKN